jgi:hypothetical protein
MHERYQNFRAEFRNLDLSNERPDWYPFTCKTTYIEDFKMAKPSHKVKKANHGKRPANNRGRKAKNKKIKTP